VTERLLRAHEVAELLAIAPATVLDWFEAGKLPGFGLGGRVGAPVRFRESAVLAVLETWRANGPGARGEVSPTPSATPTRPLVLQASPTPQGGENDA
jgi:predicted DNA-binding transcriptional regulator AlpA